MGAHRATKILGIFARLDKRDGKPQYLKHLPRLETYLSRNCISFTAAMFTARTQTGSRSRPWFAFMWENNGSHRLPIGGVKASSRHGLP